VGKIAGAVGASTIAMGCDFAHPTGRLEMCYFSCRSRSLVRNPWGSQMRRREFIALMGGSAAALSLFWPLAARAQQPAMPVIGYLQPGSPNASQVAAFRKGLSETGFVEGKNVAIEFRWAHNDNSRLPELAADLVRRRVAVIVTPNGFGPAFAAKAATATIPIVFGNGVDPVQTGLVASLNRPGGNLTGINGMGAELGPKLLGLLHELVPGAARFAVLVNPTSPAADTMIADLQGAAATIGRQIEVLTAVTNRDIDAAFASLVQKRVDALVVVPGLQIANINAQLVTLAARHAVPAIYPNRGFTEDGGLMSYGTNLLDQVRQVGLYTGRVLKGEKPADLPIMRATRFEFIINLKTARALGLEIPPGLLAIADEVIE
jgi:putative ABC transport system substrate-binding protein